MTWTESRTTEAIENRTLGFFDGACPGNQFVQKGRMRAAFVVGQQSIVKDLPDLDVPNGPLRTNNIAEYQGLIALLEHLNELDRQRSTPGRYLICGDSELVIRQMLGLYKVRQPHLVPLYSKATQLADDLDVEFRHVRRESNPAGFLLE